MANETLGASFSIDVTDLKTGLAQANRMIRESESEFKAAAAGMEDWREEQDGVTAKIKSLSDITDIQKQKIALMNKEYQKLIDKGLDPTDKQLVELRTKINNETAALKKNEAQLKELIDAQVDGAEKGKSLKNVVSEQEKELKKLEKQYKKAVKSKNYDADAAKDLKDKIDTLNKELGENKEALGGVAKEADEAGKSFEGFGGVVKGALAGIGTALAGAVTGFFALAEGTREYRREMAQLAQNAGDSGADLGAMKDTLAEVTAVTGEADAAMEGINMLMASGLDTSQIEAASDALAGAATRFDGLKFEGMAEGLQETLATGVAVGPFAELIERTGGDLEAFNEKLANCTTEAERQAVAMQFLTESGLIEANAQYKEMNEDLYNAELAQFKLNDALAELGTIAEPIMTTLKQLATDLLVSITPFVSLIGEGLAGALAGADGAAESLAAGLNGLLTTALSKIVELAPFIIQTILALFPTLLTEILGQLPSILQTILTIISQVATELGAQLPTLIPVIIDAVLMLAETLIDNIDLIIDAGIALIIGLSDGLIAAIPQLVEKIPTIIVNLINAIVRNLPKILSTGGTILIELARGLIQAIPQLVAQIPQIIVSIVNGLGEGLSSIKEVGKDFIRGLWNGISDMASWIGNKIKGFGESVLGGIKDFFGIHSPSKVMADEVGKNLALGIGEGFEDNIAGVNKQITGAMNFNGSVGQVGVAGSGGGGVIVQQTNYYSQAHSRLELYKTKQNTAAAVRLAMAGA